jgi:hypothetical protein
MLDVSQFRRLIVAPVLKDLELWSKAAENLMIGTALQESRLTYLEQLGGGGALGPYQMEPATTNDIFHRYLPNTSRTHLHKEVLKMVHPSEDIVLAMIYNWRYATAMARIKYFMIPQRLPEADDIEGLAIYWKLFYNTPQGAGFPEEFISKYNALAR